MTEQEMLNRIRSLEEEALASARASVPAVVKIILTVLAILLIICAGCAGYYYMKHDNAVVISQEQLKNAEKLAKALDISQSTALALEKKLQEAQSKPPAVSYTVQAPTVQQGAVEVKRQIDAGTSPANKVPADKTIVTPNVEEQKVDVYRITMDKPRGIGVYASSESAGAMLQYKNVVIFGGPRYQGGYEVGAAYLIRF